MMYGRTVSPPQSRRWRDWAGFTLLELMITVAVLSLLVVIALPSYEAYVLRANRSEAIDALMRAAVCQEQIFSRSGRYTAQIGDCRDELSTLSGAYVISFDSVDDQGYVARATPQGKQTDDSCGALTLNQAGLRGAGGDVGKCWSGRSSVAST
jgi:type IV pilus assembly protein PilE